MTKVQNSLHSSLASSTPLTGQVAVVTGAARGIGEAIALRLARMGAAVLLTARDQPRLEEVRVKIEEQGGKAFVMPCDLTDAKAVAGLGERVQKEHGRCDILLNNAGIGVLRKPLIELPVDEWDKMMDTNLRGPYLMIRALAPLMIAANSVRSTIARRENVVAEAQLFADVLPLKIKCVQRGGASRSAGRK